MIGDVCRELIVSVFPFYASAESVCGGRSFDRTGGPWRRGRVGWLMSQPRVTITLGRRGQQDYLRLFVYSRLRACMG
jgi:hypothetical protein